MFSIDSDDTFVSTTEPEHVHFCVRCGGTWSHADESCVGPRYEALKTVVGDWDCPLCEAER